MNKQETKNCQKCQQEINDNKYYSVILNKNILLCPSCWELKKGDYKEKLKEKWQKEITMLHKSSGQNKNVDKNSSEVIESIHAWKTERDSQSSLSTEFGICFGCDEWNETGKEHGTICRNKAAEKKELEKQSLASNHKSVDQDINSKQTNYLPWILGGIGVVSLVGLVVYFVIKNNKKGGIE